MEQDRILLFWCKAGQQQEAISTAVDRRERRTTPKMTWRQVRCAGSGYGAAECAEDMQARHLRAIAAVGGLSRFFNAFCVIFFGDNDIGKVAESRVAWKSVIF